MLSPSNGFHWINICIDGQNNLSSIVGRTLRTVSVQLERCTQWSPYQLLVLSSIWPKPKKYFKLLFSRTEDVGVQTRTVQRQSCHRDWWTLKVIDPILFFFISRWWDGYWESNSRGAPQFRGQSGDRFQEWGEGCRSCRRNATVGNCGELAM